VADTMYVEQFVAPETVNTMPPEAVNAMAPETLQATQAHGRSPGQPSPEVDQAGAVLTGLHPASVDYDGVTAVLEDEGAQKFVDSFKEPSELFDDVEANREALTSTR
jgi:transaldolase